MVLGRFGGWKTLVTALTIVGATTAYAIVARTTPRYQSETTVVVVPPLAAVEFVSAPEVPLSDRLTALRRGAFSRTRLERIIAETDLYGTDRKTMVMEELVAKMRKNIEVIVADAGQFGPGAFVLRFTYENPKTSRVVAEKLVSAIIAENLKQSENRADARSQFLESRIEEVGSQVTAASRALSSARAASAPDLERRSIEADALRSTYKDLLTKRQYAMTEVLVSRRQIGEQFRVLDGASLPERPIGPTRTQAAFAGGIAGLALGIVLSVLLAVWRAIGARWVGRPAEMAG